MKIGKLVGPLTKTLATYLYQVYTVICIQGADNLTLKSFLTVDAKIIAEAAAFPASTAIIERWL